MRNVAALETRTAGARPVRRSWRRILGADPSGYLLIAPAYLIYIVFILIPVGWVLVLSLTNYRLVGGWAWVGLANFRDLWQDENFTAALHNTAVYSVGTIVPSLVLGLLLAYALNRRMRGVSLFRQIYYLPNVVSTVASAVAWLWIFDPTDGFLNRLLSLVGLPGRQWLYDPATALGSLILVGIWRGLGLNLIIYLSGLQSIPRELFEAARVDGASERHIFSRITLPLLHPQTFFLVIMGFINGFQAFDQIYIMTGGGPANVTTTLVHQIYLEAFFFHRLGYASAIAVFLMLVIAAITLANFRYGQGSHLKEMR